MLLGASVQRFSRHCMLSCHASYMRLHAASCRALCK
jgi:hypothetical protein